MDMAIMINNVTHKKAPLISFDNDDKIQKRMYALMLLYKIKQEKARLFNKKLQKERKTT